MPVRLNVSTFSRNVLNCYNKPVRLSVPTFSRNVSKSQARYFFLNSSLSTSSPKRSKLASHAAAFFT